MSQTLDRLSEITCKHLEGWEEISPQRRLSALALFQEDLQQLHHDVEEERLKVVEPYRRLVLEVIEHWREVMTSAEAQRVRQVESEPLLNPYQAGKPVEGELFVGREEMVESMLEMWDLRRPSRDAVLFFGHRRTGKTSLMLAIKQKLLPDCRVAYVDLQRLSLEDTDAGFLARVARLASKELADQGLEVVCPNREEFDRSSTGAFDDFLEGLRQQCGKKPCFLLLDELEVLATGLQEGRYTKHLLEYFRAVVMRESWLTLAFAARHTFEEQALHHQDQPLFGGLRLCQVGLLGPEAARNLLIQPHPDFRAAFDRDATERILALSGGQPYLIQLLGWHLVHRLNQQRGRRERPADVALADVEAVLLEPDLWHETAAYGDGVLEEIGEGPEKLLRQIAAQGHGAHPLQPFLREEADQAARESLRQHEIVAVGSGKVRLTVPLLGLWLEREGT